MSPQDERLERLVAAVLDDLDWKTFVTADRGAIRVAPRRASRFSPIIEDLRSFATEFLVVYPKGGGPGLFSGDGDLVENEWEVTVVLGEKAKLVTWVDDTWSDSNILVRLGDALQDTLLELTTEACPPCPLHHRHPLNALDLDDDARWLCRVAGDGWSCRMGEYKSSAQLVSNARQPKRRSKSSRKR